MPKRKKKSETTRKEFLEKIKGIVPKKKPKPVEEKTLFTQFIDHVVDSGEIAEHHRTDIQKTATKQKKSYRYMVARYLRGYFGLPDDKFVYQEEDTE